MAEAVAEKETMTVQVGLHPLFVKVAVTPVGRPDAAKVTAVVVPLTRVASIDDDGLLPPWTTVRLLGEGVDRLKPKIGAGVTLKVRLVEWLAPPPEASIDTVTVPRVAVPVAENETVTLQVGLHPLLVNVAVTPVGRPDAEKVTGLVVPELRVAVIMEERLLAPCTTERLLGDGAERLKSKVGGGTVIVWYA